MTGIAFKIRIPKAIDDLDVADINCFLIANNTNQEHIWYWSVLAITIPNFRDWQLEIYDNDALAALFKLNYSEYIVGQCNMVKNGQQSAFT